MSFHLFFPVYYALGKGSRLFGNNSNFVETIIENNRFVLCHKIGIMSFFMEKIEKNWLFLHETDSEP